MHRLIDLIFWAWLCWIGANLLLFFAGVLLAKHSTPCFDGFRIHMPERFKSMVNPVELAAAIEHEQGHRARGHVWENLICLLLFRPVSKARRVEQELEADDYVKDPGALACCLMKTSMHPFDLYRAERLIARAKQCSQAVGDPSERDARVSTH